MSHRSGKAALDCWLTHLLSSSSGGGTAGRTDPTVLDEVAQRRLEALFECMRSDEISSPEKTAQLAEELGEYHETNAFRQCRTMGDIVLVNLQVSIEKTTNRH